MQPRTILNSKQLELAVNRLCYQLIENHNDFSHSAIVGLQPRGIYLAQRIHKQLQKILNKQDILIGNLDVTFFRDDFRRRKNVLIPQTTKMDFIVEGKKVILIDDVLFTGRTARSGLDAILSFGRPTLVELLVLIDRRFSRHLPIQPNYIGKTVDVVQSEKVKVAWKETEGEDIVVLLSSSS